MRNTIERLRSLRVCDVMSKAVVPVSANQTMADAAAVFMKNNITGAPVVDEQGHCVGVLSTVDFARREGAGAPSSLSGVGHELRRNGPAAPLQIEEVDDELVRAHMASAVQTVPADVPLLHAARMMCVGHVHRLPVLDERGHPIGMLTSLDLVAAMVQATDEFPAT